MVPDERRREARWSPTGLRGRIRPGHDLVVLNVSTSGALIEAARQLRPGSHIHVHLETTSGHRHLRATVLRCTVATIDPFDGISYRAALNFTEPCEWLSGTMTREG
jgi:hypothetical protein